MLNPTDIEVLKGNNSRYAVVIGVAKRARDIAEIAEENKEILIEKTVSLAINDIKSGEYKLVIEEADDEETTEE